ncbi:Hypothetical protein, putative [Bodo saltans]|uniref:Uncharacterized protein n=1 Tax=Bodo saltans TaxID=75058 RepID=A0A0S4IP84_BODSA|nr:Hypothetical protein, putative [Bodo saltans]|eukprot:CUE70233.1 Hypothetical protein, putative [Bodo saltans]
MNSETMQINLIENSDDAAVEALRLTLRTHQSVWGTFVPGMGTVPIPIVDLCAAVASLSAPKMALLSHLLLRKLFFTSKRENEITYAESWIAKMKDNSEFVLDRAEKVNATDFSLADHMGETLDLLALDLLALIYAGKESFTTKPQLQLKLETAAAKDPDRDAKLASLLRAVKNYSCDVQELFAPLASSPIVFEQIVLRTAPAVWIHKISQRSNASVCAAFEELFGQNAEPQSWMLQMLPDVLNIIDAVGRESRSATVEGALTKLAQIIIIGNEPEKAFLFLTSLPSAWLCSNDSRELLDYAKCWIATDSAKWIRLYTESRCCLEPILSEGIHSQSQVEELLSHNGGTSFWNASFSVKSNIAALGATIAATQSNECEPFVKLMKKENWCRDPSSPRSKQLRERSCEIAIPLLTNPNFLEIISHVPEYLLYLSSHDKETVERKIRESFVTLTQSIGSKEASIRIVEQITTSKVLVELGLTVPDAFLEYLDEVRHQQQRLRKSELSVKWLKELKCPLASPLLQPVLDRLIDLNNFVSPLLRVSEINEAAEVLEALVGRDLPSELYTLAFKRCLLFLPANSLLESDAHVRTMNAIQACWENLRTSTNLPAIDVNHMNGTFYEDVAFLRTRGAQKLGDQLSENILVSGLTTMARLLSSHPLRDESVDAFLSGDSAVSSEHKELWASCATYFPLMTTIADNMNLLSRDFDPIDARTSDDESMNYIFSCWAHIAPLKSALDASTTFKGVSEAFQGFFATTPNMLQSTVADEWNVCAKEIEELRKPVTTAGEDELNSKVYVTDSASLVRWKDSGERKLRLQYAVSELRDGITRGKRTITRNDALSFDEQKTIDFIQQVQINAVLRKSEWGKVLLDAWDAIAPLESLLTEMISYGFPIAHLGWDYTIPLFPSSWEIGLIQQKVQILKGSLVRWKASVWDACENAPRVRQLSWRDIGSRCSLATTVTTYTGDHLLWKDALDLIVGSVSSPSTAVVPTEHHVDFYEFDNTMDDAAKVTSAVIEAIRGDVTDVGVFLVDLTTTPIELDWIKARAEYWRGVYVFVLFRCTYRTHIVTDLIRLFEALSSKTERLVVLAESDVDFFPRAISSVDVMKQLPTVQLSMGDYLSNRSACRVIASNGTSAGKSEIARAASDTRIPLLDDYSAVHSIAARCNRHVLDADTVWLDVSQYMLVPLENSKEMGVASTLCSGPVTLALRLLLLFRDKELRVGSSVIRFDPETSFIIEQPVMHAGVIGTPTVAPLFRPFVTTETLIDCNNLEFSLECTNRHASIEEGIKALYFLSMSRDATTFNVVAFCKSALFPEGYEMEAFEWMQDLYRFTPKGDLMRPLFSNFHRMRVFLVELANLIHRDVHRQLGGSNKHYWAFAMMCIEQAAYISCLARVEGGASEISLAGLKEWGLQGLLLPSIEKGKDVYFWDTHFYDATAADAATKTMPRDLQDVLSKLVDSTKANAMTYQAYNLKTPAEHSKKLLKLLCGMRSDQERLPLFEQHMGDVSVTPTVFLRTIVFTAWNNAFVPLVMIGNPMRSDQERLPLFEQHMGDVSVTPTVFLRIIVFTAWNNAFVPLVMIGNPAEGKTYVVERIASVKEHLMHAQVTDRYYMQELGTVLVSLLKQELLARNLSTEVFVDRHGADTHLAGEMKSGHSSSIQCSHVVDSIARCCNNNSGGGNIIHFMKQLIDSLQESFPIIANLERPTGTLDANPTEFARESLKRLCELKLAFHSCSRKIMLHPSKLSSSSVLLSIDELALRAEGFQKDLQLIVGSGPVSLSTSTPATFGLTLDEWTTSSHLGVINDTVSKANSTDPLLDHDWRPLRLTLITNPHANEKLSLVESHGSLATCPVHPMPFTASSLAMCVTPLPYKEAEEYHEQLLRARIVVDTAIEDGTLDRMIAMILHSYACLQPLATTTQRDIIFCADALLAVKKLFHAAKIEFAGTALVHALGLILNVVFVARLETADKRMGMMSVLGSSAQWTELCTSLNSPLAMAEAAEQCSKWLVNAENFTVPRGIELESIRPYLIAMLICSVAQPPIPCAIVDEPGTGKTEAARLRRLTQATSEHGSDVRKSVIRVLYDEANLPQQSLANKALHQPLDDRRVAVTSLLNAPFDAPNMSRCVNIVNASFGDAHIAGLTKKYLERIDPQMRSDVVSACTELLRRPFFHRRDLIFFLRGVNGIVHETTDAMSGGDLVEGAMHGSERLLIAAAVANFDGDASMSADSVVSPQRAVVNVFQRHLKTSVAHEDLKLSTILTVDRGLTWTGAEYTSKRRFLALVDGSNDYSDIDCLLHHSKDEVRDAIKRHERLFFSSFADDQRPEGISTSVARFRGVFTEGQSVMMQNWEQHATPFLAVLNRQLSAQPGTNKPICVFPLASGTRKAEVKAETNLVVIVKADSLTRMLSQIRSRFETHFADVPIDHTVMKFLTRAVSYPSLPLSTIISPSSIRSASKEMILHDMRSGRKLCIGSFDLSDDRDLSPEEVRLLDDAKLRGVLLLGQIALDSEFRAISNCLEDNTHRSIALKVFYRHRMWCLDDATSVTDVCTLSRPWLIACSDNHGFHDVERKLIEWQPRELRYTKAPRYIDAMKISSQAAFEKTIKEEIESSHNPLLVVLSDLVDAEHIHFVRFLLAKLYNDALQAQTCSPFFVGILLRVQNSSYPIAFSPSWNVVRLPHLYATAHQKLAISLLRHAYCTTVASGPEKPVPEPLKHEYIHQCAQELIRKHTNGAVVNKWVPSASSGSTIHNSVAANFYSPTVTPEERADILKTVLTAHEALKKLVAIPASHAIRREWESDAGMTVPIACEKILSERSRSEASVAWRRSLDVLQYACYGFGLISLERATKAGALVAATNMVTNLSKKAYPSPHVWQFKASCSFNPWMLDYVISRAEAHKRHPRMSNTTIEATTSEINESALDHIFDMEMLHLFADDLRRRLRGTVAWVAATHTPALLDAWSKTLSFIYSSKPDQLTQWSVLRQAVALVYASLGNGASQFGVMLQKFCVPEPETPTVEVKTCKNAKCGAPIVVILVSEDFPSFAAARASVCDMCCCTTS